MARRTRAGGGSRSEGARGRSVIGAHAAEDAVSAWRFLRLHPDYLKAWWAAEEETASFDAGSIPIRRHTDADLAAAAWGLLAWEDPMADDGPSSPFWATRRWPRACGIRSTA